jgi:hypothetical protein
MGTSVLEQSSSPEPAAAVELQSLMTLDTTFLLLDSGQANHLNISVWYVE